MKKNLLILSSILLLIQHYAWAQNNVGINTTTPHSSAALHIESADKGILIPRLTTAQRTAIVSPAKGLLVFDNDTNSFWYYNGTVWQSFAGGGGGGNFWQAGASNSIYNTNTGSVGIGTTTPSALLHLKSNTNLTSLILQSSGSQTNTQPLLLLQNSNGQPLLSLHSDHSSNVFLGANSGYANAYSDTTGKANTLVGSLAGSSNTKGYDNTALGNTALQNNTTASRNIAIGSRALFSQSYSNNNNVWDSHNIAIGYEALFSNNPTAKINGIGNTALGNFALRSNTLGFENTGIAPNALRANSWGYCNTAIGVRALQSNTEGYWNEAHGVDAMALNTIGANNIAMGFKSLYENTTGSRSIALGITALENFNFSNNNMVYDADNIAIGYAALNATNATTNTNGIHNVGIGTFTMYKNTQGTDNTAIGFSALYKNITGNANTALGMGAMDSTSAGGYNTALGATALRGNKTGSRNTALGYNANVITPNLSNATAIGADAAVAQSNTIVLGSISGVNNSSADTKVGIGITTPSHRLEIRANSSATLAQLALNENGDDYSRLRFINNLGVNYWDIEGKANNTGGSGATQMRFSHNAGGTIMALTSDGNVGIGTTAPTAKLQVAGDICYSGTLGACSDRRYKQQILPLNHALEKVQQLIGVSYYWKTAEFPQMKFNNNRQLGFIAQDIEQILPEVVFTDNNGYKAVDYAKLTPILVEAIKEQQQTIDDLQKSYQNLQDKVANMEQILQTISSNVSPITHK